ncbi:MAG: DNA translocase FtsK [Candidatus Omnitrophota bacterium]
MDQARKNEIVAVVLFALSLFLFLSIFTFNEHDLSFYTSLPNLSPQNLTGVVGSYIGGVSRFVIGRAAYVIPLLIMVWGISRLFQLEPRNLSFKLAGAVVLVTAVSASFSMLRETDSTLMFSYGGTLGSVVSSFLVEYLGRAGAGVFISAMILLSILVATEFLILPIVMGMFRFFMSVSVKFKTEFPQKLEEALHSMHEHRDRIKNAKMEIAKKIEVVKKQVEESRKLSASGASPVKLFRKPKFKPESRDVNLQIVTNEENRRVLNIHARTAPVSDAQTGEKIEYKLPGVELLCSQSKSNIKEKDEVLKARAAKLEHTLLEFAVEAKVVKINRGPVITMYELEPAMGTKVNRITSLSDNISLAMRSANIRIVAPIPGKGTIGIEVPNTKSEFVLFREIIESTQYHEEISPLKLALGKDILGSTIVTDLAKMPHLLIAGTTGSGKTVCLNGIITSLLYNLSPDELKILMIDPKRVELMIFSGIPHLVSPIVTNPKKAAAALNWVVEEMERRYEMFAEKGVRNINVFKEKRKQEEPDLPYIVVIVDELADLMMVAQQDVEGAIMRIAQLSRAAGIHMIIATQRPSVNVITGVIKANFPARISFKVASKVDSRTVLDANGAEKLLGRGDMLLMDPGASSLIRGQCSLLADSEIREVVRFIKGQAEPQYVEGVIVKQEKRIGGVELEKDELYEEAVKMVLETKQASVSMLQRRFRVGYTRAARMIDFMEEDGIVGAYNGAKPREILIENNEG